MAQAISLKPEDLGTGGGGILADNNVRFDKVYFGMEDYGGKGQASVVALKIEYTDLDTDLSADPGTGKKYQQSWSIGATSDCVPSDDGKQLIGTKPPKESSNYGMFMTGLANAIGGDEFNSQITDDITVLQGMEAHMFQQPDSRPTAKPKKDAKTGREYPATIPMVDTVMVKPWDKKGKKAAATPDAQSVDVNDLATKYIKEVLIENPAGLSRQDVVVKVFQKESDNDTKAKLAALISQDDAFVSGIDGVTFADGVMKLG